MKLKDYVISFIGFNDHKRHFIINEETLCGKIDGDPIYAKFNVTNHRDLSFFALLCVDCINKLPDRISREIKFKYIVMKLKG